MKRHYWTFNGIRHSSKFVNAIKQWITAIN